MLGYYRNLPHWLILKVAQSIDGFYATEKLCERLKISCPQDLREVHLLRSLSDCLITSGETIRRDNPKFDLRFSGLSQAEQNSKLPALLICSDAPASLTQLIDPEFCKNRQLIIYGRSSPLEHPSLELLTANGQLKFISSQQYPTADSLVTVLRQQFNCPRIIIEGGNRLMSFFTQALARFHLRIATGPVLAGPAGHHKLSLQLPAAVYPLEPLSQQLLGQTFISNYLVSNETL